MCKGVMCVCVCMERVLCSDPGTTLTCEVVTPLACHRDDICGDPSGMSWDDFLLTFHLGHFLNLKSLKRIPKCAHMRPLVFQTSLNKCSETRSVTLCTSYRVSRIPSLASKDPGNWLPQKTSRVCKELTHQILKRTWTKGQTLSHWRPRASPGPERSPGPAPAQSIWTPSGGWTRGCHTWGVGRTVH